MEMSNVVASFVIFAVITGLWATVYTGLQETYGFTPQATIDNETIMDKLNDINIISGINQSVTGIYDLKAPTGAKADILGALASAAIGVLKIITGVITFPIEIIGVITGFYYIPPLVCAGAGLLFIIYIAFMLWDAYKGK
jgi:hypothetical protein